GASSSMNMKKIALATVVLGVVAATPSAFAQCPPGSWLCADISIGTAPPPVYVQPAPVYVVPPAPPPVIVQPPPPPVVVYQPRPVYVQPAPTYVVVPRRRRGYVGIQGQLAGAMIGSPHGASGMGGLGAGLRFRSNGFFGGEVAFNAMWGRDYN